MLSPLRGVNLSLTLPLKELGTPFRPSGDNRPSGVAPPGIPQGERLGRNDSVNIRVAVAERPESVPQEREGLPDGLEPASRVES